MSRRQRGGSSPSEPSSAVDSVASVDTWLLPSDLARSLDDGGRPRRTARDWAVDSTVFAACLVLWAAEALGWSDPMHGLGWLRALDLVGGALMCVALWWRRELPVAVGIGAAVVGAFSNSAVGALLVAFFSVALHRGWRWGFGVAAFAQLIAVPYMANFYPPGSWWIWWAFVTLVVGLCATAGVTVRARRQLVHVLSQRAEDARRDQGRRVADARAGERERIAREMHDVLAHRLSLLAVHAGALEYRISQTPPGAVPPEITDSVGVIRESAHLSLEELRDVLQVLRAGGAPAAGAADAAGAAEEAEGRRPPAPTLATLDLLVAEARTSGQRVTLTTVDLDVEAIPAALQRTAYRVVQEGLTNARKHAPGSAVDVELRLLPPRWRDTTPPELRIEVGNAVAPGVSAAELPGAGTGLIGLGERAAHHGGSVERTVRDGRFVVTVVLPVTAAVTGWTP